MARWPKDTIKLPKFHIHQITSALHARSDSLQDIRIVKDTVYWPGLNDQLEKLILNCELSFKYSHSKCQQKQSQSLGQEIPVYPWTKLATDIFHFESASYLLIVDYTSRFQVVCKLSSMTSLHVASQCKLIFSEYGWPETLISDNGSAIPHKPSPVLCSLTVLIILPALCITCSQMVLLRCMSRLCKACSTKLKKKAKIFTSVL